MSAAAWSKHWGPDVIEFGHDGGEEYAEAQLDVLAIIACAARDDVEGAITVSRGGTRARVAGDVLLNFIIGLLEEQGIDPAEWAAAKRAGLLAGLPGGPAVAAGPDVREER